MFTANTMSAVIEVLGLSLPHSSTMAAEDFEKELSADKSAEILVSAIEKDIRPLDLHSDLRRQRQMCIRDRISIPAVFAIAKMCNTAFVDPPIAIITDICLLYTSPSPRDRSLSRMPSSA